MTVNCSKLHPSLPVFHLTDGRRHIAYVPGSVVPLQTGDAEQLRYLWSSGEAAEKRAILPTSTRLEDLGQAVMRRWQDQHAAPFRAECLSLQLDFACDLACSYCFARPMRATPVPLDIRAVAGASRLVAEDCKRLGKPFHFVAQGLGEPLSDHMTLRRCADATRSVAAEYGLEWRGHLTTNGQSPPARDPWVARAFQSISISCDGPPQLHDAARPRRDGGSSSQFVLQAVEQLRSAGVCMDVRATLTPHSLGRLEEIVRYVHDVLRIDSMQVAPAFRISDVSFGPAAAEELADEVLRAEELARVLGMELSLASPRLTELHGGYCESLRNALRIRPDGQAINCFAGQDSTELGRFDSSTGRFLLNEQRIQRLRTNSAQVPSRCRPCINAMHCSRTCPENCAADASAPGAAFLCALQQQLAVRWIWRTASESIPADALPSTAPLRAFLSEVADRIDTNASEAEWRSASAEYTMESAGLPLPPWAQRGDDLDPAAARAELQKRIAARPSGPVSVYLHIPFCSRKCLFCDCHSATLGRPEREERYVRTLLADLRFWRERSKAQTWPVTTIHFGGGTPDCLRPGSLEQIVSACRETFLIAPATEWAIETTAALLSAERLDRLTSMGFRRLHVGVQTLSEPLRLELGRQTPAAIVLRRLQDAMQRGFVVSVDVVYGLPGQGPASLLDTLSALADAGIHGVSVYRLNLTRRNRGLVRRFPDLIRDPIREFALLQVAEQFLLSRGYAKNHFVHYALPIDHNLYFRHAVRGEDLIAVGASAAGSISSLTYHCLEFPRYVDEREPRPALQGAVVERAARAGRDDRRRLQTAIMSGTLAQDDLAAAGGLADKWRRCGLLRPLTDGCATLTGAGSWLAGQMVAECRRVMNDE